MESQKKVQFVTCDAGGTMTDVFLVDSRGRFSVGKASTTPQNESIAFWESTKDALGYWGIDLEKEPTEIVSALDFAVYTGTGMLNTLLQRRGQKVGVLTTKGFEDGFVYERGFQKIAGYPYADRLHTVTHLANPPLVPLKHMKGIAGRIDMFGKEVISLYEDDVRQSVKELLDDGIEAICIVFLYSYINPSHEQMAMQIAKEVMAEMKRKVPVFLSSDISPIIRELPRLNSTVIQAYAAEPSREQLLGIEKRLKDNGFKYSLYTLLAYGGLADIHYPRFYEAIVSGPVGGLLGAKHMADIMGIENMVTTDLGGTSFDIGLVMAGTVPIIREPEFARFRLNLPMVAVNSVGSGVGLYVHIDPVTNRVVLGPESAGADPGPVCYDAGNEIATIVDCDLILGILNPDYYLGGHLKLNKDKAYQAIKEKIADPLGVDPYTAAEGVVRLSESIMADQTRSTLLARGYSPAEFVLISFGGAGPMHMAGYTAGIKFKGVVTMPFAAAFSAFGCATQDYTRRYHKTTHLEFLSFMGDDMKVGLGSMMNTIWEELENMALVEAKREGFRAENVQYKQLAFVRYFGQVDDIETPSPHSRIRTAQEFDSLISAFEEIYSKTFSIGAKFPEAGYQILELGVVATVPKLKPVVEQRTKGSKKPEKKAFKGTRKVYYQGNWAEAKLYEMDELLPGNEINGMAVVEAPNTTLFVPPGRKISLDERSFIWME